MSPTICLPRGLTCMLFMLAALVARAGPVADETAAMHVVNRLSFGPEPGDIERVMTIGIDAYVDEQLHPERLAEPPALVERLATLELARASQADLVARFREFNKKALDDAGTGKSARQAFLRQLAKEAAEARLLPALASPRQLQEVMVDFWFNHFNVFQGKGLGHALVAGYEREAIRPFVLGRFRDLLGATAHHPAMLFYLDNWLSAAPGFQPARTIGQAKQASGLNENYARELMELHTLGVDGGYSQHDVTELARILTGWTIAPRDTGAGSLFVFAPRRHDYGSKQWLGYHVNGSGQAEGEWALDVLARHPATARRIAFKLAQQFVSDDPSPALVEQLARRFLETDGDIRSVLATLFASAEFRDPAHRAAKFKSPYRYLLSSLRASGQPMPDVRVMLVALHQQGMPLHGCQTPDGYKNTEAAWLNPEATTRRVSFATALGSGRLPMSDAGPVDAQRLMSAIGPMLGDRTRSVIAGTEPPLRSALMLGSPDFMRY
ncbi:MAG: hypothetical protein RL404_809 [Pseudomonadota bacterium]